MLLQREIVKLGGEEGPVKKQSGSQKNIKKNKLMEYFSEKHQREKTQKRPLSLIND